MSEPGSAMNGEISAIILTRDEESTIEDCLRSLAFCRERIVVDGGSLDGTVQRALPLAEHVYRRLTVDLDEQRRWARAQAACPWVLFIDADERVPPGLSQELVELARMGTADAWWIRRRNDFFGAEVRGAMFRGDRSMRFFRKDIDYATKIGETRKAIQHFGYPDWSRTLRRLRRDTLVAAEERRRLGEDTGARRMLGEPVRGFLKSYFWQGGWRSGLRGYVLCSWRAVELFLEVARLRLGEFASNPGQPGPPRVERIQGRPVPSVSNSIQDSVPDMIPDP